ncbi:MAG: hypothetical protein AMXMBFR13_04060 [Phycisphaerae bacterium]
MKRRDFIRTAAASGVALAAGDLVARGLLAAPAATRPSGSSARLTRRPYGKNGVKLSILGFPGFALRDVEQKDANRVVAVAIERGINYFDVAPTYGNSELILGPALEPFRKDVFLACKTTCRDRAGAEQELKQSLARLRTDYFDLYQLHAITGVEKDVDAAFAKGGAMEAFIAARKAGLVRHLGFSAHSVEAALAAMDRFDFDSALVPINFSSLTKGRFGTQIIETAQRKGVTLLALKGLARQKWPGEHTDRKRFPRCWYQPITDRREARLSLRYTLSQPVAAAIPPADVSLLPLAMDVAAAFSPITRAETEELKAMAASWDPVFTGA